MSIVLALLGFVLIIGLEVPGLIRKKMWRELAAFSAFLTIGMALTIPQLFGIRPFEPNPSRRCLNPWRSG